MCQNVLRQVCKKRRLWNWDKSTGDYNSMIAYKRIQAEVVKAVKKAKSKFERKLSKEARRKPRAFYAYVNKQIKSRVSVGPLKDSNSDVKFQLLKFWILSLVLYSPRKILVIHHNLKQHLKERFPSQQFTLLQKKWQRSWENYALVLLQARTKYTHEYWTLWRLSWQCHWPLSSTSL